MVSHPLFQKEKEVKEQRNRKQKLSRIPLVIEQAAEAKEIAADAQRDLDQALPALDEAVASLKNLSKTDIVEVKSMRNPPEGVKLVMAATCIMFSLPPKMVADPNKVGKKIPDYLEQSAKLLSDPSKVMDMLVTYD